jgi:hypothetical protein
MLFDIIQFGISGVGEEILTREEINEMILAR